MQGDLIFGILKCNLPEDTIDGDLKVCTLRGIHTFIKDRITQIIKCSPWGTNVQPCPSLKRKMMQFMRCRRTITTLFANRYFHPKPKVVAKCNLVSSTRLNRAKLSQLSKINVGSLSDATQWNWAATLGKAKDVACMTTNLAPIQTSQPMDTTSTLFPTSSQPPIKFTEHSKYCAICTPLGKTCPKDFPMSSDWDDEEEEDQVKDQSKDKDNDQKTPQTKPRLFTAMTLTLQPPKPSITEYFGKISSVTPIMDALEERVQMQYYCDPTKTWGPEPRYIHLKI